MGTRKTVVRRKAAVDPAAKAALEIPELPGVDADAIYDSADPIGEYPSYAKMVRGFIEAQSRGEGEGGLAPGFAHDLQQRIDRLEAALRWYADPQNHRTDHSGKRAPRIFDGRIPVPPVYHDKGAKARAVFETKE